MCWALLLVGGWASAATMVEPRLRVGVEGRYDDDLLLRHGQAEAPVAGELLGKLTARAGVNVRGRTFETDAFYAPDLQLRYFSRSAQLDHRVGADLSRRLSARTGVTAELRGWRVTDPTSLPRTGMGHSLSPVLYGTADLGWASRLTRTLEGRLRYRLEGTRFLDGLTPPGSVHAPQVEAWLRRSPRASFGLEYRFQYFLYGAEHSQAHAPAAAFRYRVGRHTTFLTRAGPVFFRERAGSAGEGGVAPRVHLELTRALTGVDLGAHLGQDLLGATGFVSAVWAQYAGLHGVVHLNRRLQLFGAAYGFRNGAAPGGPAIWFSTANPAAMAGYAVGGGVEWRFDRHLSLQAQLDRIAQVGGYRPDVDLTRNIAAVRLLLTAW